MAQNEYEIYIDLHSPKESVWKTITDFGSYPEWNSVLSMSHNDSLEVGEKFHVTINTKNGKKSRFKAKTLSKRLYQSFAARQVILGKWVFSATHYFIIEELENADVRFIQKWELTGILSKLFKKQIFEQLGLFKQMNEDLKNHLEKGPMEKQSIYSENRNSSNRSPFIWSLLVA